MFPFFPLVFRGGNTSMSLPNEQNRDCHFQFDKRNGPRASPHSLLDRQPASRSAAVFLEDILDVPDFFLLVRVADGLVCRGRSTLPDFLSALSFVSPGSPYCVVEAHFL